jgi:hypothetical protein
MTERKRRRPRTRRVADDDRPRGFEPGRMRTLWRDIDQARDSLGLGSESGGDAAPRWSLASALEAALALLAGAAVRLGRASGIAAGEGPRAHAGDGAAAAGAGSEGAPGADPEGAPGAAPACALLARGARLLAALPVVGRVLALLPVACAGGEETARLRR